MTLKEQNNLVICGHWPLPSLVRYAILAAHVWSRGAFWILPAPMFGTSVVVGFCGSCMCPILSQTRTEFLFSILMAYKVKPHRLGNLITFPFAAKLLENSLSALAIHLVHLVKVWFTEDKKMFLFIDNYRAHPEQVRSLLLVLILPCSQA